MIRSAKLADMHRVLDLVKKFYPMTTYSQWAPLDDDTVLGLIEHLINTGIMLLAEEENELIGIVAFAGTPFLFNANIVSGHEVVWWVLPEKQKSGVGIELLRRADALRKLRGWKSLQMVRLSTSPAHLDRVLESEGFQPSEFCFTKVK